MFTHAYDFPAEVYGRHFYDAASPLYRYGTCDVALATGTIKITYLYNRHLRKTIEITILPLNGLLYITQSRNLSVEIMAILRTCV